MKVRRVVKQEIDIPGLGERLRQARLQSKRSVASLATAAGISRHYWYQLEGEAVLSGVTIETLRNIEQALGADLGVDFNKLPEFPTVLHGGDKQAVPNMASADETGNLDSEAWHQP